MSKAVMVTASNDQPVRNGRVPASMRLHERAARVIPGAAQTFSKSASQLAVGVSPMFIDRAAGAYVWDVDGHRYLDYMMGLGPAILGHAYEPVVAAQIEQLRRGQSPSLSTLVEVEVAELICEIVPCAEMVRFGKNGSDVTAAAIKLARFATKRDHVAAGGYHGWQDWTIGATDRAAGIPQAVRELTHRFNQRDPATLQAVLETHAGKIAAVILEPANYGAAADAGILKEMQRLAHQHGAVLIFDEVLSGFRTHRGCIQGETGVTPDLCTLGKALANGAPLSAIAGRADLMKPLGNEVFFSFTFGGEAVSLAAARATLTIMRDQPVCDYLIRLGQRLREGINQYAEKYGLQHCIRVTGPGPLLNTTFGDDANASLDEIKTFYVQEMNQRGILCLGYMVISFSHTDADIDATLQAYDEVFQLIRQHLDRKTLRDNLRCPLIAPVVRSR